MSDSRFATLPLLAVLLALAACSKEAPEHPVAATDADPRSIEEIADEFLAAYMERYPSMATAYSLEGFPQDKLYDNSPEALAAWQAREDAWLAELRDIGQPAEIGSRDWVTYGMVIENLEASVATRICRRELWETSTTTGWYTNMPFVFDIQPIETDAQKEEALARLSAVDEYIDTEIANLRKGLELGYSSPRLTVDKVPAEVRSLLDDGNPFLSMGERANDEVFEGAVSKIFEEEITPAVNRFADFIEIDYLEQAREEIAISYNPDGAECYPHLVRSFATVSPTPDEIHQLGLKEMASLQEEMMVILEEHFPDDTIPSMFVRLNSEPEFTFRTEEDVVAYSEAGLAAAKEAMSRAFGLLPKADVIIKPYPEFAASGSGEYHSSSEDGTRPGIFYIAVKDPEGRSRMGQQATLYHEAYPGHHHQGAISLELGDKVHPVARYFWNSGYGEGWALYSERLADELGLYGDHIDLLGLYSSQAGRAARLVIDTGIHTKGWTRQQAVDYMIDNTGWAPFDVQNEINRYISWPGQATSYMLGNVEIRRLRNLAEDELGEDFDLKEFHDRVIENGSVTLPMLDQAVMAWIERVKQE